MMTIAFKQQQHEYLDERQLARSRLLETLASAEPDMLPKLRERLRMVDRQIALALNEIRLHA